MSFTTGGGGGLSQQPRIVPAAPPPDNGALQSEEAHFWDLVERTVSDIVEGRVPRRTADVLSIQFPLGGAVALAHLGSVTIGFKARVMGYTFTTLTGGEIVVDVQRSSALTHPVLSSLCGPDFYPALNGFVTGLGTDDVSGWLYRDLERLDMLHLFCISVDPAWVDGVFTLHVVRL